MTFIATPDQRPSGWFMPEESARHKRTWMAFIASDTIWHKRQIAAVQGNLALLASTIANYEAVSMLVRQQDRATALQLLKNFPTPTYPIELIDCDMDDLWLRDTGPVFVINDKAEKAALDVNFNGWGGAQACHKDAKIAAFVTSSAQVLSMQAKLVLEGGCFEVDGQGTAIMTESCLLNANRNPHKTKADIETELKALLGLTKIIWLKGIKGQDITDGHTDFYARFARPGVVVVSRDTDPDSYDYQITRDNIKLLSAARDAQGRSLEVVVLDTPWDITTRYGIDEFAAGYVGYYVCNGAVIMQKFGDKRADEAARKSLAEVYPQHQIEQIAFDASGGGSIHCATQQEPEV